MENGKAAISIGFIVRTEVLVLREFHVLTPLSTVLPEWLYYLFFDKKAFVKMQKTSFTGTAGQLRVSTSFLENYEIPVPLRLKHKKTIVLKMQKNS